MIQSSASSHRPSLNAESPRIARSEMPNPSTPQRALSTMARAEPAGELAQVLIVVFLIAEPRGVYGLWVRARNYFKAWPFSY